MNAKLKNPIKWIISGLVTFAFVGSAIFKLSGAQATVQMAKSVGGPGNLIILGVLELFIALLFLIPRTGVVGSLLMIAYMGGAMATLFVNGQSITAILIIEILIWIAAALRFPELSQRLFAAQNQKTANKPI